MTRNPNTRVEDMHLEPGPAASKHDALTLGSLFAAAFIVIVSFIASRFYD